MSWTENNQKSLARLFNKLCSSRRAAPLAIFDADGTLWNGDIGESFFQYEIEKKLAPGIQEVTDPWEYYKKMEATHPAKAYAWLAQINAGVQEQALRQEAAIFYREFFRPRIHPAMNRLMIDFKAQGVDVWICTASVRWAVEPALLELELAPDHLIAVESKVKNGRITREMVEPLPYGIGKKECLMKKFSHFPIFVAGNTQGDLPMMELATDLALVVGFEPRRPETQESEDNLRASARLKEWPIQIFR